MSRHPCPVCGDPNAFPLWIDDEPPDGCPGDEEWLATGRRSVNTVAECRIQRVRAWQAAEMRRLAPQCFDDSGNMRPGSLAEAMEAVARQHRRHEWTI